MMEQPTTKRDRRSPVRIVLVDDHPIVRERLAEMINREPDLTVCGEADSAHEALDIIQKVGADLAIVDLGLKDSHGLDLIKNLHVRFPTVAVLVLSMQEEMLYAERVFRAGARGYITKSEAGRCVLDAIWRILAGELYFGGPLAKQLASRFIGGLHSPRGVSVDGLSDRELQVLEMIGAGLNTRHIAERMHLHPNTIETYRTRIKEKLGLKDSEQLLQTAILLNAQRAGSSPTQGKSL